MENNYWYVGQKVSDQRFGNENIININTSALCPILVDFGSHKEHYYIDGKYRDGDAFPSLSQNPHVSLKYKKIFKKGDVVWCFLNGELWYLGVYDSLEEGNHKVSQGYTNNGAASYEYLTDEQIKEFIELKV